MSNYYDRLTRMYPISKTIRQELIPVGNTLNNIKKNRIIEADKKRSQDYVKVKALMDEFHKAIINESLYKLKLSKLNEAFELYTKKGKTNSDEEALSRILDDMRKEIADTLKNNTDFEVAFSKDLIEKRLPEIVSDEDKDVLESFKKFTTYFTGYKKVRENLYSADEKHSTVAYRVINENLFIFFSNILNYRIFKEANLSIDKYSEEELDKTFMVESYNEFLTQKGIDYYNNVVANIRSVVNIYSQQHVKDEQVVKIPKMKALMKQVLSEKNTLIDDLTFGSDKELIDNLESFATNLHIFLKDGLDKYKSTLAISGGEGVYVKNDSNLSELSNILTGKWNSIKDAYDIEYDSQNFKKKKTESYYEVRDKEYKKIKSFEMRRIAKMLSPLDGTSNNVIELYIDRIDAILKEIDELEIALRKEFFSHDSEKKLQKNTNAVATIKDYLDSIKRLERTIKLLTGTGLENRNELFYGEFAFVLEEICIVDNLYNITRNYLTKKPFSTEKIKLNFNNPQLLGGWDVNKEKDCYGILLLKNENYYLAIMDKSGNKVFENLEKAKTGDVYKKVNCKLLPGPNKMFPKVFFSNKNIDFYDPDRSNKELYDKGTYKKGQNFNLEDCHKIIDFYKKSIEKHPDWREFNFKFSDTSKYEDISGFFAEVESQNYKISFSDIDTEYIDSLVEMGKIYLFQIYNKDFSLYSKGKLNLHTLYLKMLFDERNLSDVVLKLNGEAEVFYRPASIDKSEIILHKANERIKTKNPNYKNRESLFIYDIVKDRRYTGDKFLLHFPVTLNYKERPVFKFNSEINKIIKYSEGIRTIGIDRGERNLLYVVVCDTDGSILYQKSLNEIISEGVKTDYHSILDNKEKERLKARRDWKSIENIKDLKTGYLSQVVHEIVSLIIKYNAVVVLEDLNMGFKTGRQKVEKQVYQKFEKALIDKLNFLCIDKTREQNNPDAPGHVLNAYQLTAPFTSFEKIGKQTGCVFYVPAYLTSQIDPTTGFANLFYAKYTSKEDAVKFFSKFKKIYFDKDEGNFIFKFNYDNFTYRAEGTQVEWVMSTQGSRIEKFRAESANGNFVSKTVYPTKIIQDAFKAVGIMYEDGHDLINDIIGVSEAGFFKELYRGLNRTLQMRNSSIVGEDVEEDYIISPIKNSAGYYYDSRCSDGLLPEDADANGAYNIARKGLWAISQIKASDDPGKIKLAMTNKEWLSYAQKNIPI